MRTAKSILVVGFIGLSLLSATVTASVYRWVDQEGVVHYGDQPQYSDVKKIKVRVSAPTDKHFMHRTKQRHELLKNYNEQQAAQALKEIENSSESEKKKIRCARASKLKASYATATQLYHKDKSGKRVTLSSQKKKAAMQEVAVYLTKWCS